jgi:hypothetical protein
LINKKGSEISAIHPEPYMIRFLNFMKNYVVLDRETLRKQSKEGMPEDSKRGSSRFNLAAKSFRSTKVNGPEANSLD